MQGSSDVLLTVMNQALLYCKSMILTSLRQCTLLSKHGVRWTLAPSEIVGKRLAFYLNLVCQNLSNPLSQLHLSSTYIITPHILTHWLTQTDPIVEAEMLLEYALDDLQNISTLHPSNCMNISDLLNPTVEVHKFSNAMDSDIYLAVMDAKAA